MTWENNIKMYLREIGYDDGRWMKLAQDHVQWQALVLVVLYLQVLLLRFNYLGYVPSNYQEW
jgi:hypothetical protein